MTASLRAQPPFALPTVPAALPAVSGPTLSPPRRPVYVLEVLAPLLPLPPVPGWTLQAWPVARLGDLTLQATPQGDASPDDLRLALQAAGFSPLGPVRRRA
ncbi:hypothetical protein [Deinococcus arcticus]|nr:hypothetical protein [Deinococcus arcticus]